MTRKLTTRSRFHAHMITLINEYAGEAEHQEGSGYWTDMFETDDQVVDDFILYLKNIRNPSGERS